MMDEQTAKEITETEIMLGIKEKMEQNQTQQATTNSQQREPPKPSVLEGVWLVRAWRWFRK